MTTTTLQVTMNRAMATATVIRKEETEEDADAADQEETKRTCIWVVVKIKVPFWGTLKNRCHIIIGTQKGTLILTTTHLPHSLEA